MTSILALTQELPHAMRVVVVDNGKPPIFMTARLVKRTRSEGSLRHIAAGHEEVSKVKYAA